MAPRKKSQAIKSTGATSSKAAPLPDWVKNGGKPPPASVAATAPPAAANKKGIAKAPINGHAASVAAATPAQPPRPPPLFPPGTKTPQNLLNERIQKLYQDWHRPDYHPRPVKQGDDDDDQGSRSQTPYPGQQGSDAAETTHPWTCSVTLSRPNPKDRSTNEVVRMSPDERDDKQRFTSGLVETKEMARHWGATYVLFRLFSNQSLGLMLPSQFRDYWSVLDSWKKSLPPHLQATMFAADPFAAQEQIRAAKREREEKAAATSAQRNGNGGTLDEERLPKRWKEAREVRMTKSMRDWVEEIVKTASSELPDLDEEESEPSSTAGSSAGGSINAAALEKQLHHFGFRSGYIGLAISWLKRARSALAAHPSTHDPLLSTIKSQPDSTALLTYLTLYVPEEDLPDRFKASKTSSNEGFVTSTQSGQSKEDGLKRQWAVERIAKTAGYPKEAAEKAILASKHTNDVGKAELEALRILADQLYPATSTEEAFAVSNKMEELTVLKSILGEERICPVPAEERPFGCSSSPNDCLDIIIAGPSRAEIDGGNWGPEDICLRVLWKEDENLTSPTFYVSSPGSPRLPAYLRLALTQFLLKGLDTETWRQDGQVLLPMVEALEESWRDGITRGDKVRFEKVMAGFTTSVRRSNNGAEAGNVRSTGAKGSFAPARPLRPDPAVDKSLLEAQQAFQTSATGRKLLASRSTLPISHHQDHIESVLSAHRLVLATGSTGSGKTTQLPQFILDAAISRQSGSRCKIIVTQPRRVSAMSIAERVAHERGEAIGQTVGWAVRGERKVDPKTNRILFTTTGLLLRRLQSEPDLASISTLIIDEIHERGIDSDLLLLEVVGLLKANPSIKVVLMSATLQKEKFVRYFEGRGIGKVGSVDVEGRIHPVDDYYLENLIAETNFRPSGSSNSFRGFDRGGGPLKELRNDLSTQGFGEGAITAMEVLERERSGQAVGQLDYDLVGKAVAHVASREAAKEMSSNDDLIGAILVFMSGVGEIRQACEAIRSSMQGQSIEVLPLHSNLSNDEQQRVFKPVRSGVRKIVVSTNVAEASITIDGVTAVIDSGRVKETHFDPDTGLVRLVEQYTSKSSAMQRRGRAGRTRKGECWKLFSRTLERRKMLEESQPEMTRTPLDQVILHALSLGKRDPGSYLSAAVDPPSLASIASAITNLHEAGAIKKLASNDLSATALGRHLTNLPLDLRLGKLLILGCTFQCLSPLLTVSAIMSCKPLFFVPFEEREKVATLRQSKALALGIKSDLLVDAAIYDEWTQSGNKRQFAAEHFLSVGALRDIGSTRVDLLSNLQEIGFCPRGYRSFTNHALDAHADSQALLQSLLTSALWPDVIRIAHPDTKYNQSSSGTVARETEAKSVKLFDEAGRVFLQPGSILFGNNKFSVSHLACFKKSASGQKAGLSEKVYLRDATESPVYALLLLCGAQVKIHHLKGGISVGRASDTEEASDGDAEGLVRLRAPARIGVLSSQLRRLLDRHLEMSFEGEQGMDDIVEVMRALLDRDGMGGPTPA